MWLFTSRFAALKTPPCRPNQIVGESQSETHSLEAVLRMCFDVHSESTRVHKNLDSWIARDCWVPGS